MTVSWYAVAGQRVVAEEGGRFGQFGVGEAAGASGAKTASELDPQDLSDHLPIMVELDPSVL